MAPKLNFIWKRILNRRSFLSSVLLVILTPSSVFARTRQQELTYILTSIRNDINSVPNEYISFIITSSIAIVLPDKRYYVGSGLMDTALFRRFIAKMSDWRNHYLFTKLVRDGRMLSERDIEIFVNME